MTYTEGDIFKVYQFAIEGKSFEEAKKEILENRVDCDEGRIYTLLKIVCDYYDVTHKEIRAHSRLPLYVNARRIFCFLCRKFTEKSLYNIGRLIDRDHATVLHQTRNAQDFLYIGDKETVKAIDDITLIYYKAVINKHKESVEEER
tara:strand:- start:3018 stop:3455 length:438 start_codon:yes stop_codon:yes gene_type:complete